MCLVYNDVVLLQDHVYLAHYDDEHIVEDRRHRVHDDGDVMALAQQHVDFDNGFYVMDLRHHCDERDGGAYYGLMDLLHDDVGVQNEHVDALHAALLPQADERSQG